MRFVSHISAESLFNSAQMKYSVRAYPNRVVFIKTSVHEKRLQVFIRPEISVPDFCCSYYIKPNQVGAFRWWQTARDMPILIFPQP